MIVEEVSDQMPSKTIWYPKLIFNILDGWQFIISKQQQCKLFLGRTVQAKLGCHPRRSRRTHRNVAYQNEPTFSTTKTVPPSLPIPHIIFSHIHDGTILQRGILRHLVLVLDLSESMGEKDFKPTYQDVAVRLLKQFVSEFYDQNPISQLSLVVTRDGVGEKITDLSSHVSQHLKVLDEYRDVAMLKGDPSLQNALELARATLT